MAPNNTATKMSVDFDLTDIEDIDAVSDEFEADSSDDDTFISNKNKKITKKREKRINVMKNNNMKNNNIENFEKIITKLEEEEEPKEVEEPVKTANFNDAQTNKHKNDDSEEEEEKKTFVEKITNAVLKLNAPTDHFHQLERTMNGPGWMVTSSSATQSEDELGAFERDEFTFKMCQVIRRSGRHHHQRKKHHLKHQKIIQSSSEDTTAKTETSTTEVQPSEEEEESSEGENMLKFCSRSVPLAALNEDDL